MNNFKRLNNLIGWGFFLFAALVYMFTLEPSVSLWDCGEFASSAYSQQVPHPPGAPLFVLVGRLFALMAPSPESAGFFLNMVSAISSAATVMFTFWITTQLARRIYATKGHEITSDQARAVITAGIVAAGALTFMDTFWFSAVESEVYAMASFFISIIFWAGLKWDEAADQPHGDRWLILIAYLVGLSVGAHLLALLALPAVIFLYYFRRHTATRGGVIITFLIAAASVLFVMKGLLEGIPKIMAFTDRIFVNEFGLPFYSGLFFTLIVIIGIFAWLIRYTQRAKKYGYNLNLLVLSTIFITLGMSTYGSVMIRSLANPAIDMNNPEEPYNFVRYITREQYGQRPLFYGPYFNSPLEAIDAGSTQYSKGDSGYYEIDPKPVLKYAEGTETIFPRMVQSQDGKDYGYRWWGGMNDVLTEMDYHQNVMQSPQADANAKKASKQSLDELESTMPTFGQNLKYFFDYQVGYMYWRYLCWNFVGRQNDDQGLFREKSQGNWISGIPIIDNIHVGSQKKLPPDMAINKAHNKYFFLPLILGFLGIFFQATRSKKYFGAVLMLFFYTGFMVIFNSNEPPLEPRERDYALVGSFQTFCIWIGLAVLWLIEILQKKISTGKATLASGVICVLAAPVLMGSQTYDDHDRSGRYLGIHFAKNYLSSCDENAVLLCNGDNDTYPLWYAQNVEGYRTDVRIINQSLLPTDWYSSVLKDKVYKSEPLPLTLTKHDLRNGYYEQFEYQAGNGGVDPSKPMHMRTFINMILGKNKDKNFTKSPDGRYTAYGTKYFYIPVNREAVIKSGAIQPKDYNEIVDTMYFSYPQRFNKGTLVLFDLLMTNAEQGWKRPLYFTSTSGFDFSGLNKYLQCEGLTFRIVPMITQVDGGYPLRFADDRVYDRIMNKYLWSNMAKKKNFHLDDKAKLVPQNIQQLVVVNMGETYRNEVSRMMYETKMMDTMKMNGQNTVNGRDITELQKNYQDTIALYKERTEKMLDKMVEVYPESVLPMRYRVHYIYAELYKFCDKDDKAKRHFTQGYENAARWLAFILQYGTPGNLPPDLSQNYGAYEDDMRIIEEKVKQYGWKDTEQKLAEIKRKHLNN